MVLPVPRLAIVDRASHPSQIARLSALIETTHDVVECPFRDNSSCLAIFIKLLTRRSSPFATSAPKIKLGIA